MTVDSFLKLEDPNKYDFTDECVSKDYKEISCPVVKYCVYKAVNTTGWNKGNPQRYTDGIVYPAGSAFSDWAVGHYGKIVDPDSNSPLLQEIYRLLWGEKYLAYSLLENKDGKKRIKADTMNSAQTTINKTMEEFRIRTDCAPREKSSIKRLIHFYAQDGDRLSIELKNISGLSAFLSAYHTLGNFIPTPFNAERTARTKDYWDLTLRRIYKWYCAESEEDKNDELHNLLLDKEHVVEKSKQWLLAFGNWDNFVETNYLQDFVNINDNKTYGAPKELWAGHFSKTLLPSSAKDIEQYYTNASSWIRARGNCMVAALRKNWGNRA